MRKQILMLCLMLVPTGVFAGWTSSAPEAWDYWVAQNERNAKPIDHSVWNRLLKKYVMQDDAGLNRFAYARVTAADKAALKAYIGALAGIEITDRARLVQRAYWINLYNALTILVVLDHYPVASIRDIDISGLLANGPWGKDLITVEDVDLSLDAIEHDILRPIWKDPRIHYAVNCASIGCPNLHDQAFTAQNTDRLLDMLARGYINSPRGLRVEDGEITVSKIYKWFAYDFGNSEAAILRHLARYADTDRKVALQKAGEISDTDYDWSLNE